MERTRRKIRLDINSTEGHIVTRIKPYEQKYDYSCGAASLLIAYRALGVETCEDDIIEEMALEEEELRNGIDWEIMLQHPPQLGLDCQLYQKASFEDLLDIYRTTNSPIIVGWWSDRTGGDKEPDPGGHYSVVKAIKGRHIMLADPSFGNLVTYQKDIWLKKWRDEQYQRAFMVVGLMGSP